MGSNFINCIVCEYLKDLISKIGKNSVGAREHEIKFKEAQQSP
jgi:hypothetical protein